MASEAPKLKQVFTDMLRQVSEEVTEFVEVPQKDGEKELMVRSKAEALARFVWKQALGYEEVNDAGEKVKYQPDKWAITLLFDRLEGKVVAVPLAEKQGRSISDRVGDQTKKALNKLAE
jgi:hypothetical protein